MVKVIIRLWDIARPIGWVDAMAKWLGTFAMVVMVLNYNSVLSYIIAFVGLIIIWFFLDFLTNFL